MKVKIFTHTDLDGYGCSILANLAAGRGQVSAEYCGYYNINEKVEEFINSKYYQFYDYVFITDISINDSLAKKIDTYGLGSVIKLIDHHPTALNLNKYDWCLVQVEDDIEKVSGTSLFYDYLVQNKLLAPRPALEIFVEAIKRYDTWLWKDKYNDLRAKELNDLFKIYGPDRFFDEYYDRLTKDVFCIITDTDKFLLELENEKIRNYINKKSKFVFKKNLNLRNNRFRVGIVVADEYINELANEICEANPDIDFVAIISGLNNISFRTIKDDVDLGKDVAKYFGGGGHEKAAGATIDLKLKSQILNALIRDL